MTSSTLLALTLLFAQAQDAPMANAPAVQIPVPAVAAPSAPPPETDFELVAWCHGVLSGHMQLAERVQEVEPLDEVQQRIGNVYLRGYEEALGASPDAKMADGESRATAARAAGLGNWRPAMESPDLRLAADTYLAWQLPGRCEHAAKRLAGRDDLFAIGGPQVFEGDGPISRAAQPDTSVAVAEAPPAASEDSASEEPARRGLFGRIFRRGAD
jgi:hypothetical protein